MSHPVLKLVAAVGITGTLAYAAAFNDSNSHPGASKEAVQFGWGEITGWAGEVPAAAATLVHNVKPGVQQLGSELPNFGAPPAATPAASTADAPDQVQGQ